MRRTIMAELDSRRRPKRSNFAREEIEKKRKLALQQAQELAEKQRADLKAQHYMKCPKCGMDLHTLAQGNVDIDTCFNCRGVWLDAGELDQLVTHGP
jgi:hypothetical protein